MKFKDCFRVENVEAEATFLLTERNSALLCNNSFQLLVPLLDGHHTVEEIIEKIRPHLLSKSPSESEEITALAQVHYALMQLEQKGYLIKEEDTLPRDLAIFCEHLGIDPKEAHSRLQTKKVAVSSFVLNLPIAQFKTALESLHIQVSDRTEADLEIVLTDDYLQDGLSTQNRQALDSSRSWMLVKPVGTIIWLGPIFVPGISCWQCLAQRLQGNRPVEKFLQKHQNISTPLTPPLASLSATLQTALGMAATEVFKWIVRGENKQLEGVLVTYDTLSLKTQNHVLVKRPQCLKCGLGGRLNSKPLPILLGHRKKSSCREYRLSSPEQTLNQYQHHISPITGVVRELSKVERGTELIHTYLARHHFATVFDDLDALRQYTIGRSGGTARTDLQAKCSSFCEAIERYSGVFQGDEIRQKGSYRQMGDRAIHPNTCMNFSPAQYQNRQEWNARCSGFLGNWQKIPEPFDESREIEWIPVWSFRDREFKYLPTAYCYYGYPNSSKPDCWADSNGCAAGNTLESAILHGFMELVERDAIALWWYNRIQKPQVDLDSFNEPYFKALKEYYQTLHRDLWILDLTSDLNIPAFAAISRRTNREVEDIIFDFGVHFDPKTAIYKALNGMNKILHAVSAANLDGSTRYGSSMSEVAISWWKTATIANQPYLVPSNSILAKSYADYPQVERDDLFQDVMTCQQIVEQKGMELLVLDQTRPDIGLKVVKVIVPGLRHFWKRLGEGRLYDIPVQSGWLKEPMQEKELNPIPMWM
ncbi:TOMM precursor leader peptide-binding protein [Myxosarcina sp. GI1]|uniref:TOMM precursor leader peptide-binding protein n=1 Tax=Myxosarcina sp. GI1 TaxID=1541065 RepID=UPI000560619C|nr:TOMM precursor leader peptide-binding protein [Myxosarcina sp. GI1]